MIKQNRIEKQYFQGIRPWHYLHFLKNPIDFAIRNKVQWNLPLSEKENVLFSSTASNYDVPVKSAAIQLISDYHLDEIKFPFHKALGEVNLYYLDLFQTALLKSGVTLPSQLIAVDVGPSDWFYLPALVNFLRFFQCEKGRDIQLEGYEIDPFRVYDNFHARHNIANQRAAAFDSVQYHLQPFIASTGIYDLVLQCFPFLFLKDHLSWGLPKRLFNPEKLLSDIVFSMKSDGLLLIINQGKDENELQKELLSKQQLIILNEIQFLSDYKTYDHEHYVLVAKK